MGEGSRGLNCNPGCGPDGVTIDARTYRGKCNGVEAAAGRQFKGAAITGCEQGGLAVGAAFPYGTDGMDDELCGQVVAASEFCIAGDAVAEKAALLEQAGSRRPVDRPIDATTSEQGGVCRVYDCVDGEGGDIGPACFETCHSSVVP